MASPFLTVCRSLELLAWDVVHGEVVHVGLDELEGLLLDHANGLAIDHGVELLDQLAADALPLLRGLVEGVADDLLHIIEGLDALAKAEAEVPEPLVVESDRPVLAKELNRVRDDVVLVALSQLVQVVLMQANEAPQALQDDLLVAHVGDRVDQADAVEGELDEMALSGRSVQVVTYQVTTVFDFDLTGLEDKRVGRLDVVVDDVVR